MDDAIKQVERMRERVRHQVLAAGVAVALRQVRAGGSRRAARGEGPGRSLWELDLRHRQTIQLEEEL